jgi:hypothetical protein
MGRSNLSYRKNLDLTVYRQISPVHAFLGVPPWSESLCVKSWLNCPGRLDGEEAELKVWPPHAGLAHKFSTG